MGKDGWTSLEENVRGTPKISYDRLKAAGCLTHMTLCVYTGAEAHLIYVAYFSSGWIICEVFLRSVDGV